MIKLISDFLYIYKLKKLDIIKKFVLRNISWITKIWNLDPHHTCMIIFETFHIQVMFGLKSIKVKNSKKNDFLAKESQI